MSNGGLFIKAMDEAVSDGGLSSYEVGQHGDELKVESRSIFVRVAFVTHSYF